MAAATTRRLCLALAALALCVTAPTANAQCELNFTVNPQLSTLSLGGGLVAPAAALVPTHPEAVLGLQGAAAGAAPGACPDSADALTRQLQGWLLGTTAELGPLELYPPTVQAATGGLATLELVGVAVNFSTTALSAPLAAGNATAYSTDLSATLAGGHAVVQAALLSPSPIRVELAGISAGNATEVAASVEGGLARIQLAVHLSFPYTLAVDGSPLQVSLEVVLQGSLVLEAALGCPGGCGAHGRCWLGPANNASDAAAAMPTCQCKCGYQGPACSVPSGYCPRYSSEAAQASAATCPAGSPAPVNATAGLAAECPPCASPADCNSHQEFNASLGTCQCLEGWGGDECEMCTGDAACAGLADVDSGTCSTVYTFQATSQVKIYSCNLQAPGLESLLRPAFTVTCNTTTPAPPSTAALDMRLTDGTAMACRASGCSFAPGSTRASCATMHCECAGPCDDFQAIIQAAEGQPTVLDCSADGTCYVAISGFYIPKLAAACTTAECLVNGYSLQTGGYAVPEEKSYDVLIAALPLLALLCVTALLSVGAATHRAYWAAARAPPLAAPAGHAAEAAPDEVQEGQPVEELRFDQLSCTVPLNRSSRCMRGWMPGLPCWRRPAVAHMPDDSKGAVEGQPSRALPEAAGWARCSTSGSSCDGDGGPQERLILAGVSGVARRGELVGVMGPSGCGKTTLLALCCGSTEYLAEGAQLEGAVLLDGVPLAGDSRRKVAFVPQDDTLLPTLTVAESLAYQALLRLPNHPAPHQVQASGSSGAQAPAAARVWQAIEDLGLQQVAGSRVGGALIGGRGISGGERRRVSIGMELVADPAVLVLDEPTSGLDSYTALNLMRTLKHVASAGRICLLSFHQPSPAMFALLDRAYLLARGACVFAGPPSAVESAFTAHGLPCPAGAAVAEHMLQVVSDPQQLSQLLQAVQASQKLSLATSDALSCSTRAVDGAAQPQASAAGAAAGSEHLGEAERGVAAAGAGELDCAAPAAPPTRRLRLRRELAVLFWRTATDTWRNPSLLLMHWALALGMGLLMGVIFYDQGKDMSGIQNRGGAIYFSLAFFAFTSLTTTDILMAERRLVVREVQGGCYSAASYLACKAALDGVLLRVVPVLLYCAPFYPMLGFAGGARNVALFLLVLATYALAVAALALAVAASCRSAARANLLLTCIFLLSLLVGGFLVNIDSIPPWIAWLHYLSLFFYAYDIMTISEFQSRTWDITVTGFKAYADVSGTRVLSTFGIDAAKLTTWIVVLDCLYPACLALAFALLYWNLPRPQALRGQRGGAGASAAH